MNYIDTKTFAIQLLELQTIKFYSCLVIAFLFWLMIATSTQAEIVFEEVTTQSGITTSGRDWGASWTDFNSDSWPDFWASMHNSFPVLYINNGNGTFTNRINEVWPNPILLDQHGAAWADFDNDGDPDLLQLTGAASGTGAAPNQFFVNYNGLLQDQAIFYGLDYPYGRGRTPLWLDWNLDGQLDVFIANSARTDGLAPSDIFLQLQDNSDFYASQIPGLTAGAFNYFAHSSDLRGDGTRYLLVHNLSGYPGGVFAFNSNPAIDSRDDFNLTPTGNARDAAIADFNNDLRPDIYIARQIDASQVVQTTPNHLDMSLFVRNTERGVDFQSGGPLKIAVSPPWSMPLDNIFIGATGQHPASYDFTLSPTDPGVVGILNHTPAADFGLYIGFEPQTQKWSILLSGPAWNVLNVTIDGDQPILNMNTLGFTSSDGQFLDVFLLQTDTGFVDRTETAGMSNFLPCGSVAAGDFDNDTDIDIYLACNGPAQNVPNVLYENLGNSNFGMVQDAAGATGSQSGRGNSATVADFDRDGFLDLLVTNGFGSEPFTNGPVQLFHNKGNNNHWFELDLEGVQTNRDAIGARVLLTAGGITQMRERDGGMHFGSQNYTRLHFGLGSATLIEQLVIYWPNGIVQTLSNLPVDHLYHVTELTSSADNCTLVENPAQRDTDNDGFGNYCDADLNQDLQTDLSDFSLFRIVFATADPDADFNGDGSVDLTDFSLFRAMFGSPPGPSGLVVLVP